MTRTRYRFVGNDAPDFLTMTIVNWLPVFTRTDTVELLFTGWRFLQHEHLRIHGYVFLNTASAADSSASAIFGAPPLSGRRGAGPRPRLGADVCLQGHTLRCRRMPRAPSHPCCPKKVPAPDVLGALALSHNPRPDPRPSRCRSRPGPADAWQVVVAGVADEGLVADVVHYW